jgi:AcrR family transcriptional regulator
LSGPSLEGDHLHRLPPGRHGLSREFVVENQRGRLAAGIIEAVAGSGYQAVTISQIAAAAGVSRRTFYMYFSSKEECFLSTYDMVLRHLCKVSSAAIAAESDWPAAVRGRLAGALDVFAANPDLLRFCLIAPVEAGGAPLQRYRETVAAALEELTADKPEPPRAAELSPAMEVSLMGGIASVLVRNAKTDEEERLDALLPDLLVLYLTPYVGHDEAQRVARVPGKERHG